MLISVPPSMDMLNNTHPLTVTTTPSTGTLYPLINVTYAFNLEDLQISHLTEPTTSAEEHEIVEALLGLRERSVVTESDGLPCE